MTFTFVLFYYPDGRYSLACVPSVQYAFDVLQNDKTGHGTIAEIEAYDMEAAVMGIRSLWLE